jgi:hypothetical protein
VNILFVHQNFPGQFKHLAPALVLRQDGFSPDVIVAHPGWGESLRIQRDLFGIGAGHYLAARACEQPKAAVACSYA